jgi:hypothetical protein
MSDDATSGGSRAANPKSSRATAAAQESAEQAAAAFAEAQDLAKQAAVAGAQDSTEQAVAADAPPPADAPPSAATPPAAAPEAFAPLDGLARAYLEKLLKNIGIMLAHANDNGMALPTDLRRKLDELLRDPELSKHSMTIMPAFLKK